MTETTYLLPLYVSACLLSPIQSKFTVSVRHSHFCEANCTSNYGEQHLLILWLVTVQNCSKNCSSELQVFFNEKVLLSVKTGLLENTAAGNTPVYKRNKVSSSSWSLWKTELWHLMPTSSSVEKQPWKSNLLMEHIPYMLIHLLSLLHVFYIVYTSLLIYLKHCLRNQAATELWPNKGQCVFLLRRKTNTEV